jgi:dipeptidyl aminopeptidase/acylaminoacyl peptidase
MRQAWRGAGLALGVLLAAAEAPASWGAAPPPAVTIEDLLKAEGLEDAWFSPDGGRLAIIRSTAVAGRATQGLFDPRLYGARVEVLDLKRGESVEVRGAEGTLFHTVMPFNPASGGPWTPDGRGLLLTAARDGAFELAYWDAATHVVTVLPGRPPSSFPVFAWAGERLIYAALAPGAPQRNATRALADNLQAKWSAAWSGRGAAPTVSSSNPHVAEVAPTPGRLMLADLRTGRASPIGEGDYGAVYVAPGQRRFAAIRFDEPLPDAVFPIGRRGELEVHELGPDGAKLVRKFPDLDVDAQSVEWDRTGNRLLVGAKTPGQPALALYLLDLRTGSLSRIAPPGLSFSDPQVGKASGFFQIGWIGDRPAAIAAIPAPAAAVATSEGVLDYGEHARMRRDLYAFDAGRALNLTGATRSGAGEFLAPADRSDAYVVADGGLFRVGPLRAAERVSPAGGPQLTGFAPERRYPPPPVGSARFASGGHERIAVRAGSAVYVLDPARRQMARLPGADAPVAVSPDFRVTVGRKADRWVDEFALAGGEPRALATVNAELAGRAWSEPRRFSYSVGGRNLTGWVLAPPGAPAGARLPAVVVVYGGQVFGDTPPAEATGDASLPVFSGQLLAAQGYAVIYPSLPLGRGDGSDLKQTLADEAVAAVDALAAEGLVDPRRVGVMGQSFGGYSTAAILAARSDRFRAGIALAGIYDWAYAYGNLTPERWLADDGRTAFGFPAKGQAGLEAPFWRDADAYARTSPIYAVERMDAPLMILHGDLDDAYFDAARMYNALARAGKQPVLVRYWGEGHLALSEAAMRDQWTRIRTWFATYLDAPAPAP